LFSHLTGAKYWLLQQRSPRHTFGLLTFLLVFLCTKIGRTKLDSDEITENEQDEREHLTYKAAGVDVKKSDEMKRRMWATIRSTYTPQVYEPHPRGFAGMVLLDFPQTVFSHRYNKPLILLSTDGVGTKLKIAFKANVHNTVGIDLVAMNVNDTLVYGAEPIGFVDYFACGKLNPSVVEQVVAGIAEGCRQAGCPLLGGETAELPGFYKEGEYDLAGFVTAVVDKRKLIDGKRIEEGDLALGFCLLESTQMAIRLQEKSFSTPQNGS